MPFVDKISIVLWLTNSFTWWLLQEYLLWVWIILLVCSLLTSIWLFLVNKKQWNKLASILSWIPVLNLYWYAKAWNSSLIRNIIMPIVAFVVIIIISNYLSSYQDLAKSSEILSPILYLVGIFYLLLNYFFVLKAISKKTGNTIWATIGMFLFPLIFIPIVWIQFYKNKYISNKLIISLLSILISICMLFIWYTLFQNKQADTEKANTSMNQNIDTTKVENRIEPVINTEVEIENKTESISYIKAEENNNHNFDINIEENKIKAIINFTWIKTINDTKIDELNLENYVITNSLNPNINKLISKVEFEENWISKLLWDSDINNDEIITFGSLKKDLNFETIEKQYLKWYKYKWDNIVELSKESTILFLIMDTIVEKYIDTVWDEKTNWVNSEKYYNTQQSIKNYPAYTKTKLLLWRYIWKYDYFEIRKNPKAKAILDDFVDSMFIEK